MGRERTIHPDLALKFQVALVGNKDDRETVLVLHSQDLLVERANFLKGVPGGDGVDEQESLARAHVLLPHGPANRESSDQHAPLQEGERESDMKRPRQMLLTHILPDQQCREHQEGRLPHR